MTMKMLQVMADVDVNELLNLIDEDISNMATLATDTEITRQFETIQKELEGILKQYFKEYIDAKLRGNDYTMKELEVTLKENKDNV